MSIVGAEAVSLSDLMKLGPDALGAMAQGQTKSIAPAYMVLSALKALTEQKQGAAPNMPQGTVKDRVVEAAQPQPQQMGIAPAQQGFAEGGPVNLGGVSPIPFYIPEQSDERDRLNNLPFEVAGDAWEYLKKIGRGLAKGTNFEKKDPAERVGTEKGRPTNRNSAETTAAKATAPEEIPPFFAAEDPLPDRVSVGASATSRSGIGGGLSPLVKYGPNNVKAKALGEMGSLAIPEDAYLAEALTKFSSPDKERMAELKEAERNAGLGAFAKGMLKGRGFGGSFGPAVAEAFEAKETQAKERRQYEDARERTALELGLKKGSREYENFFKNLEFQKGERAVDAAAQERAQIRSDKQVDAQNEYNTKRAELAIRAEANKIAVEVRRDGLSQNKVAQIQKLYFDAQQLALNEAEKVYGKTEVDPALINTDMGKAAIKRQREKQELVEKLMQKYVGELETRLAVAMGGENATMRPASGPVAKDYTR